MVRSLLLLQHPEMCAAIMPSGTDGVVLGATRTGKLIAAGPSLKTTQSQGGGVVGGGGGGGGGTVGREQKEGITSEE